MLFLVSLLVFLQSTIWLPMVNGHGPRIVVPVVVEANQVDAAGPHACFDELPRAVVASDEQAAICPIPGRRYITLSGGGQVALVGNSSPGLRAAWGGDNPYTIVNPVSVLADADIIEIGNSVTGVNTDIGPAPHTGSYSLIVWSQPDGGAQAADAMQTDVELLRFAGLLRDVIDSDPDGDGSIVFHIRRSVSFYSQDALLFNKPALLGCGSGDTIEWVATGPVRIAVFSGGKILFGGQFNFSADRACMGDLRWMLVNDMMNVPAIRQVVDGHQARLDDARWNWNIGDGLQRTFSWHGWDYLSFFGIRISGQGAAPVFNLFLVLPQDFMDFNCVVLSGRKVCTIVQSEPGF